MSPMLADGTSAITFSVKGDTTFRCSPLAGTHSPPMNRRS
jgi:hypothetical protein